MLKWIKCIIVDTLLFVTEGYIYHQQQDNESEYNIYIYIFPANHHKTLCLR